jgi:aryl carrier-like protein
VLPAHLIPAHVVRLAELPVTHNGKLDRAALPAPEPAATGGSRPPEGPAEEAVAAAWRDVLGLAEVSAQDNFFACGGDSIHSLKVLARLRRAGYRVELQQLFLHQTVAELAVALEPDEPAPAPAGDSVEPFGLLSPQDAAKLAGLTGGGVR